MENSEFKKKLIDDLRNSDVKALKLLYEMCSSIKFIEVKLKNINYFKINMKNLI